MASAKISDRQPAARSASRSCSAWVPVASCGLRVAMNWCTATGLPAAALTAAAGAYGEVMAARTAVTRKSSPPGPACADGLVAILLQQGCTRPRGAAGGRPRGRPRVGRRRPPTPAGSPSGRRASRPVPGGSRWRPATGRARPRPSRRRSPLSTTAPSPAAATARRCSANGLATQVERAELGGVDQTGAGIDAVGIAAGRHHAPDEPPVTAGGMQDPSRRLGHGRHRGLDPPGVRLHLRPGTRPRRRRGRAGPPPGARAPAGDRRRCAGPG